MGCFRLDGGRIALVRNHELQPKHLATGPFAAGTPASEEAFDRIGDAALPGGTTTLLLDPDTLTVEKQYLSLVGTLRHCAGGVTAGNSVMGCADNVDGPAEGGGG